MSKLKTCPFCGGKAKQHLSVLSWVECEKCGAKTPQYQFDNRSIDAWNIRNSGWIPVAEQLPESEEEVLILTEKNTITTAMYENGKTPADESDWNWYEIEFEYDEESGIYYVPEGWWEYKHFNPDEVHNYVVDEKVIAWQPLPEPYRAVEE